MFRNFYHDFFDFPVMRRPFSLIDHGLRPMKVVYKPSLSDSNNHIAKNTPNTKKQLAKQRSRAFRDPFEEDFADLISYVNDTHTDLMNRTFGRSLFNRRNDFFNDNFFRDFERDFFNLNVNQLDQEVDNNKKKEIKSNEKEAKSPKKDAKAENSSTKCSKNDNEELQSNKSNKQEKVEIKENNEEDNNSKYYATHVYSNTVIKNGKKISKKTTVLENYDGEKIIKSEEDLGDGNIITRTQKFFFDENGTLVREITEDHNKKEALADAKKDGKMEVEDDITVEDIPLEKEEKISKKASIKSETNTKI